MQLVDAEKTLLRKWMLSRLERLKEVVDPEVLTDFVFTLLHDDKPSNQLREGILENLSDILEDECEPFVDDLFQKLSHLAHPPLPPPNQAAKFDQFTESNRSASRKRTINTFDYRDLKNEYDASPPPQFETTNIRWRSILPQTHDENDDTPKSRHRSKSADRTSKEETKSSSESKPSPAPPRMMPFNLLPDPSDPSYPMRQASFMLMQQNFPYLTQLWMNNIRVQEEAELEQFNQDVEVEAGTVTAAKTTSESWTTDTITTNTNQSITSTHTNLQPRCHDFDTTGLCIRGDACPHRHVLEVSRPKRGPKNKNKKHKPNPFTRGTRTSTSNPPPRSAQPHSRDPQTQHIHPTRMRQIRHQTNDTISRPKHQVNKGEEANRQNLNKKSDDLETNSAVGKNRLSAKLARQRRGRETTGIK